MTATTVRGWDFGAPCVGTLLDSDTAQPHTCESPWRASFSWLCALSWPVRWQRLVFRTPTRGWRPRLWARLSAATSASPGSTLWCFPTRRCAPAAAPRATAGATSRAGSAARRPVAGDGCTSAPTRLGAPSTRRRRAANTRSRCLGQLHSPVRLRCPARRRPARLMRRLHRARRPRARRQSRRAGSRLRWRGRRRPRCRLRRRRLHLTSL